MKSSISPEPALLGFLREGPLHGYDLYKQVNANLGAVWRIGLSQMYAIVNEYAARGLIKTVVAPQKARPARKMLELTPQGRRAFDAWMNQSARGVREFRVDFFARLYFARAAGAHVLRAFLDQQLEATRHEYEALGAAEAAVEFDAVVRSFRRAQLEAIMEWLAAYRTELKSAPKGRPRKPARRKFK